MATVTIAPGAVITKDPSDVQTVIFDWDATNLAAAVTISTSTFTIRALRPASDTALTKDNASILSGSRKTQIRLSAGTLGALYELTNTITTNESPTQTKERSVRVSVEQL